MTRTKKYLVALAAVAVIGGIVAESNRSPEERAAWDMAADKNHAVQQCVRAFQRNAHDPASVELAEQGQRVEVVAADQSAKVDIRVRAKNKFSAKVLTAVRCDLVREGTGWRVTKATAA